MPLINCPACEKPISTEAASCPQCGHPNRLPDAPPSELKCHACALNATTKCQACGVLSCAEHLHSIANRIAGGYELRCANCYAKMEDGNVIAWVYLGFVVLVLIAVFIFLGTRKSVLEIEKDAWREVNNPQRVAPAIDSDQQKHGDRIGK